MEESSHAHAHRPHGRGFHWLDISLALSAFFVSLVSLGLAIHNGRTMELPGAGRPVHRRLRRARLIWRTP